MSSLFKISFFLIFHLLKKKHLLLFVFGILHLDGTGQVFLNNGQSIYIGPNAILSINGSSINQGTFENNGELIITGDWENNDQYIAGQGAMVLRGVDQQIDHKGNDIFELVIEGSGEKVFISDANISGELYLEDGFIKPLPGVKIMAKSAAIVSEGHLNSYVDGAFYQQGSGKKLFPIGKNGNYSPVTLNLKGAPTLGFEVFGPNPNPYFSFEIRDISRIQFWEQTLVSGDIGTSSLITLPMQWNNTEEIALEELIIAAADSNGNYTPLETYDYSGFINSGYITSNLPEGKKLFALGITEERPEERTIYIPNAFAPKQSLARENGEDDRIKVYGKEISAEDFLFRIYNRWGVLVYQTTSYEEASTVGWNGINQQTGKLESIGSFKFMLKGKYNSGRAIEKTGSIHLIQ